MNAQVKRESAPARVVPWDPEIEQALLGAILVNNDAYDRVSDVLRVEHFHEGLHQRIYDAIAKVIKSGRTASPNSLKPYFELDTGIQSVGGPAYLGEIAASTPAVMYALEFAQLIIHHHVRRNMVAIADEITAAAIDPPPQWKPEDHINEAERRLYVVAGGDASTGPQVEIAYTVAQRAIAKAEQAYREPNSVGLSTGLESLDVIAGGLFSGDMVVLGGATSMGKTSLGQQIGWNVSSGISGRDMSAAEPRNVLAFTKEMDSEQYVNRHIAQIAGVSASLIESGRISHEQMLRVIAAGDEFQGLPLYVDGTRRLTVGQMRTRARRLIRKHGPVPLLIVDHLRFIAPDDMRAKEPDQIQQITRDLKAIAGELNTCVLLVSHLNRELWQRTSKRPILSDLFGASAIEQNADVVIFVHRESYYLKFEEPDPSDEKAYAAWHTRKVACEGKAEIICAKRRRGRTGTAHTLFDEELTRFSDLPRSGNNNQNQGALL